MSFVVDGVDAGLIGSLLSNIIEQEKDETVKIFKEIQKQAVLRIQADEHPRPIYAMLNSLTDIPLDKDAIRKSVED